MLEYIYKYYLNEIRTETIFIIHTEMLERIIRYSGITIDLTHNDIIYKQLYYNVIRNC